MQGRRARGVISVNACREGRACQTKSGTYVADGLCSLECRSKTEHLAACGPEVSSQVIDRPLVPCNLALFSFPRRCRLRCVPSDSRMGENATSARYAHAHLQRGSPPWSLPQPSVGLGGTNGEPPLGCLEPLPPSPPRPGSTSAEASQPLACVVARTAARVHTASVSETPVFPG